ncbi:NADH-quinone oxidoreductase subunit L [Oceanibacterium hippocampi]|uniref:NADH-quinone oxidoreductase subunit L n=1 Tax=Oceanibacterium hippocampi TaxID=745714 RepID=A0A1Y5T0V4_9PROT|nr:NADH-quinone oxidoreductase subunit L [Oceanibacterium hippocampi]SLN53623.1 NADH-quinone oxidoreductase subunit L [Oceanibacterium hippocampi]
MYVLIVFLPLAAALIAGFFGRQLGDRGAQVVTSGAVLTSALLSWVALFQVAFGHAPVTITLFDWVVSGDFAASWAIRVDALTAVMLVVVNTVSSLVHVYSIGYMSHDKAKGRFMAYLSLFTFAMLMLVTADNLLQLYFGWEGVGLASYLLIGFWYHKASANAAAIKAFVVNRVGDFGFALGVVGIFYIFGSIEFDQIFAAAPEQVGKSFVFMGMEVDVLTTLCLLLFLGAMGKSAQLFLHTWLPDAMEGPTPVSALIHAATMVTAGVFMVARLSPLFEYAPDALTVVTVVGGSTAFFAATVGLVQNDIKRVIAYSTCSQLGYMFFAAGVSAYPVAIFHLFTHAFFKALLFLCAGSVIHAVSDEQDMRRMGGLWKHIKATYVLMWIGSLALAGIWPFAGYFSKDMVLEAAYAAGTTVGSYAFWLGIAAAIMTAFYSWRLLFMTFHGAPRASKEVMDHVHESPKVMLIPLYVLALGSICAGFIFAPYMVGHHYQEFWGNSILVLEEHVAMAEAHDVAAWVKFLPLVAGVVGILIAFQLYIRRPEMPAELARTHQALYQFLLNKWYFDELYDWIFVRPATWLGRVLWKGGDGRIIDGLGPDGIAMTVVRVAARAKQIQTGYIYHYAFAILIGIAAFVTLFFYGVD